MSKEVRLWVTVDRQNLHERRGRLTDKPHLLVIDAHAWQENKTLRGFRCFGIAAVESTTSLMTDDVSAQAEDKYQHPAMQSVWVEILTLAQNVIVNWNGGVTLLREVVWEERVNVLPVHKGC